MPPTKKPAKTCAVCEKRKAERFCSGLGEPICAACCGKEREVKIDCPFDCSYLKESRKYDWKKPRPQAALPFPEVEVTDVFLDQYEGFIGQIGLAMLKHAMEHPKLMDRDLAQAAESMVKTYEALSSGIYYESLPDQPVAAAAFRALKEFLEEVKTKLQERGQTAVLKEADVMKSLVFVARMAAVHNNGRPKSRAFIDFLRAMYPAAAAPKQESRLIIPGA